MAAPSHRNERRGLRFAPFLLGPGAVAGGGGGRNSKGPQNVRYPRFDFSEDSERVRGCYEPAFVSLPCFLGVIIRELRIYGVLSSSQAASLIAEACTGAEDPL